MNEMSPQKLTAKDYASDQEVRWCPGCGDYAILKSVQKTLADLEADPANTVFVSGIGCSSRFPYYMATYGFHTIHGRAPAFATGIKLANPKLDVWMVTGDGDGLSIGGNHLLHVLRRNVDIQILLFNNEIYGLTKGQYSPTSRPGTRSPSSPGGSIERNLNPCAFALASGARFVARTVDTDQKHMPEILKRAHGHRGASFVEIYQNCIVFNDGVFADFTDKKSAPERQLRAEHGHRLVFGPNNEKGLRLNREHVAIEVVTIGENGITEDDILVHDETDPMLAQMLVSLDGPEMPVVVGVIFCNPADTYDGGVARQVEKAKAAKPNADMKELLFAGSTWTVD
ncbi:MAG: 2-oxoacid:ferredoxin oxidoreductase subunit beta [Sphingomonadales bacterium]